MSTETHWSPPYVTVRCDLPGCALAYHANGTTSPSTARERAHRERWQRRWNGPRTQVWTDRSIQMVDLCSVHAALSGVALERELAAGRHVPIRQRSPRARKPAEVRLVEATSAGFRHALVALSRSEPDRGYLLELAADGRWVCTCEAFQWRGDCQHLRAAYARTAERRIA